MFQSYGSLSEWWFRFNDMDCVENGIRPSKSTTGSNDQLVKCFSEIDIPENQMNDFVARTDNVRIELKTWIYIQNNSSKYLKMAQLSNKGFENLKHDLKNDPNSKRLKRIEEKYILLRALYDEKNDLDYKSKVCSNWRFWNFAERHFFRDYDCESVKSQKTQDRIKELKDTIAMNEEQFPLLKNPIFNKDFLKNPDERTSFTTLLTNTITNSQKELKSKIAKHQNILGLELSKKNIDQVLNDRETLAEYIATKYNPGNLIISEDGDYKSLSLTTAQCRINQRYHTMAMDRTLTVDLGGEIALLGASLLAAGPVGAYLYGTRAVNLAMKAKKVRQALLATEATISILDIGRMEEVENRCTEMARSVSTLVTIPEVMLKELNDCQELQEDKVVAYTLAVIGGSAAIKLSKMDLNGIRQNRIVKQGRELLLKSNSAVKAQVIKQYDQIMNMMEDIAESMGAPQLAVASAGTSSSARIDNNTQFNINQSHSSTTSSSPVDIDQEIETISCYLDGKCKSDAMFIKNGLKLFAESDEYVGDIPKILRSLNTQGLTKVQNVLRSHLLECLKMTKGKLRCDNEAIHRLADLMVKDWGKITPHEQYIERVARAVERGKYDVVDDMTSFIINERGREAGTLAGDVPTGKVKWGEYSRDGQRVDNETDLLDAKNDVQEVRAAKGLQELGIDVAFLPQGSSERERFGLQDLYRELAERDGIYSSHKNPDLILNGNKIFDIYTPARGVTSDNFERVVDGILRKSEDSDFLVNTYQRGLNKTEDQYGQRQTNRVIIKARNIDKNPGKLARRIKNEIARRRPQHLNEAVIIYETRNGPQMLTVWP